MLVNMASKLGASLQLRFRASSSFCPASRHFTYVTGYFCSLKYRVHISSMVCRRRLATKAAHPPKTPPTAVPRTAGVSQPLRAGAYQTVGQGLARRPCQTLLYQSPPYDILILGYYLASGFCFAYAAINFRLHFLDPVPGTSDWVRYSFAGISLFVVAAGLFFLTRVSRSKEA